MTTFATTMEYIKAGEYIRHGAGNQDGIVTKYEHILLSSLMIIRVTKYLPVGSFETTFEVKKQVCSLMTLGK